MKHATILKYLSTQVFC